MAGMDPIVIAIIIAVLGMAGYVAYLFVMRLPMSETGYLVCYVASFLVAMTIANWGVHYIIYEVNMWLALPIMALLLLFGWLVDRYECKQGTLHLDPDSKYDQWQVKFLSATTSADHQTQASEFRNRLDPPE